MSNANAAEQHNGKSGHGRLTLYIVIAIVLAVVMSLTVPHVAVYFEVGGEIFLRLLQMVVVPLVMASVMSGILGLGDVRKLGRPGGYAILYYLSTTVLAVATGLLVVNVINPGRGMDPKLVEDAYQEGSETVEEATGSHQAMARNLTWGKDNAVRRWTNGTSNPLKVPATGQYDMEITVEQMGDIRNGSQVQVLVSESDEAEFQVEGKTLEAEPTADTFKWTVKIPASTRRAQVKFTSGDGGISVVHAHLVRGPPSINDIFTNLVLMLFTKNLLGSMVEINLLPIIVFSIVFAGMLTTMGQRSETIANLVLAINDALMSFILLLMRLAPLGIFCLVAARFAKAQLEGQFLAMLQVQAKYMLTVLAGLGIHALITLPLLLWIFTRRNPFRFMNQMSQAILTAFSTASSTATLPVTMESAEVRAGVSKRSTEFVLPLGATINMDGTALYEAAAAIFIAQAIGVEMSIVQQLTIAVTATLAAIGAAGIPEAGLVTMLIVLNAVGLPLELIGLILPVDWLLDRFRTAVNAFGDSVGSAIVDKSFDDSTKEKQPEKAPA